MNDTIPHDTSGSATSANTVRGCSGSTVGPSGSQYIIGPLQNASGPRKKEKTAMSHFWDTHHTTTIHPKTIFYTTTIHPKTIFYTTTIHPKPIFYTTTIHPKTIFYNTTIRPKTIFNTRMLQFISILRY